ncbi:hypothetical protein RirG_173820 [Rhizophagus irregularis DAOM 197198w]|uniref:Uncharacterized protein n=1 Tax=Rhizophagus irregularis (strain DAOM 197198w) TaxID=1432141 RepID=A0A015KN34_RHIIW|nr:hypothetical protein RirG_173820 [Rhizophagus irregularis DAOM 197198w]
MEYFHHIAAGNWKVDDALDHYHAIYKESNKCRLYDRMIKDLRLFAEGKVEYTSEEKTNKAKEVILNWKDWAQESKAEIKEKKKIVEIRNAITKIKLAEKEIELAERDLRIRKASAMVCKLRLINKKLQKKANTKSHSSHVELVEKRIALWERKLKLSKGRAEVEAIELENMKLRRELLGNNNCT